MIGCVPLLPDFSPTPMLCQLLLPVCSSVRSAVEVVGLFIVDVVLSENGERVDFPLWVDAVQNRLQQGSRDQKLLVSISTDSQAFGKGFGLQRK